MYVRGFKLPNVSRCSWCQYSGCRLALPPISAILDFVVFRCQCKAHLIRGEPDKRLLFASRNIRADQLSYLFSCQGNVSSTLVVSSASIPRICRSKDYYIYCCWSLSLAPAMCLSRHHAVATAAACPLPLCSREHVFESSHLTQCTFPRTVSMTGHVPPSVIAKLRGGVWPPRCRS